MLKFSLAALAAALAVGAVPAQASETYEIKATSLVKDLSDFTLTFADRDGDGLFSRDELVSFSGITEREILPELTGVPDLPGIADGGYRCCAHSAAWAFFPGRNIYVTSIDAASWTYALTAVPTPVPEPIVGPEPIVALMSAAEPVPAKGPMPVAALVLACGLAGLGAMRLFRRREGATA